MHLMCMDSNALSMVSYTVLQFESCRVCMPWPHNRYKQHTMQYYNKSNVELVMPEPQHTH
eukprot:19368-Heterococcus_DN1.PRE.2